MKMVSTHSQHSTERRRWGKKVSPLTSHSHSHITKWRVRHSVHRFFGVVINRSQVVKVVVVANVPAWMRNCNKFDALIYEKIWLKICQILMNFISHAFWGAITWFLQCFFMGEKTAHVPAWCGGEITMTMTNHSLWGRRIDDWVVKCGNFTLREKIKWELNKN